MCDYFACMHVCALHVCLAPAEVKMSVNSLEMEWLPMLVSQLVGSGIWSPSPVVAISAAKLRAVSSDTLSLLLWWSTSLGSFCGLLSVTWFSPSSSHVPLSWLALWTLPLPMGVGDRAGRCHRRCSRDLQLYTLFSTRISRGRGMVTYFPNLQDHARIYVTHRHSWPFQIFRLDSAQHQSWD